MSGLRIWTHAGIAPGLRDACEVLEVPSDGDFLFFVATTAQQERRRQEIKGGAPAPRHLRDPETERFVLYFARGIEQLARASRRRWVSRIDERVAVRRALRELAGADEELRLQYLHDEAAWAAALREAHERGTTGGRETVTDPAVRALLPKLSAAVTDRLGTGKTREQIVREVALAPPPCRHVILDGFSFITPLQRALVRAWSQHATVHVLLPYRDAQSAGFRAIQDPWEEDWDERRRPWPDNELEDDGTTLASLRRNFFGPARAPEPGDDSVEVREFGFRQEEVDACFTNVAERHAAGTPWDDIALVVHDLGGYRALIAEAAKKHGVPTTLRDRADLLLLTPPGQFVLTLYDVWSAAGGFSMTSEQFEDMVFSGALGMEAQRTTEKLRAVGNQVLARCRSLDDWEAAFRYLNRVQRGKVLVPRTFTRRNSREPLVAATASELKTWEDAFELVCKFGNELFGAGEQSIAHHVDKLKSVLTIVGESEIAAAEQEIIQALKAVIDAFGQGARANVVPDEFGALLAGLSKEREEEEATGPPSEDEPGAVWVTTLRGVDGVTRGSVYVIGADDRRMPVPLRPAWPIADLSLAEHLAQQRYLFLSAIRAAESYLWLSFSRTDMEQQCLPSMYLELVEEAAGASRLPARLGSVASDETPPGIPEPVPAHRAEYTLGEVAQFGLCPFRHKLESLSPVGRLYSSRFHLRLLAGAAWLDMALSKAEDENREGKGPDGLANLLDDAFDATQGALNKRFPVTTETGRMTHRRWLRRAVAFTTDWFVKPTRTTRFARVDATAAHPFTVSFTTGETATVTTNAYRHRIPLGKFHAVVSQDVFREEWLLPSSGDPEGPADPERGPVFFGDRKEAFVWYSAALRASANGPAGAYFAKHEERAKAIATAMVRGEYPRNPGKQCHFCAVREPCLGAVDVRAMIVDEHATGYAVPQAEAGEPLRIARLTEQQQAVIDGVRAGGYTVVSAGAGSGKTYTMVAAVLDAIARGAHADQFALVTFTNNAADVIRVRIESAMRLAYADATSEDARARWLREQERLSGAFIGTIHRLCSTILASSGYMTGVPHSANRAQASFLLEDAVSASLEQAITGDAEGLLTKEAEVLGSVTWDEHEFIELLEAIVAECRFTDVHPRDVLGATEAAPDDAGKRYRASAAQVAAEAFRRYELEKRERGVVDPDDLLAHTRDLLASAEGREAASAFGARHRFLFVDEFQDVDPVQADIVKCLRPALQAVLLVGDEKQAIFGFRSALPRLLGDFAREYQAGGYPLPLNIARRPTQAVLDVQNAFFAKLATQHPSYANFAKTLTSGEPIAPPEPLRPLIVDDDDDPSRVAAYIDAYLSRELAYRTGDGSVCSRPMVPGDIAILVRSNWKVQRYEREVTEHLRQMGRAGVRVLDDSGGFYFIRPEVIATHRVLRLLTAHDDNAVLSLALETPFLRNAPSASAHEADLISGAASQTTFEWLQEQAPDIAVAISDLATLARARPVVDVISAVYERFEIRAFYSGLGHTRALENLEKLRDTARRLFQEERALTLQTFVEWLGEAIAQRRGEPDADTSVAGGSSRPPYVRVMTIHKAKGLEFPVVLIPGAQTPLADESRDPRFIIHKSKELDLNAPTPDLPDTRSPRYVGAMQESREERIAEEMRLLYVALTRAEQAAVVLGKGVSATYGDPWYSWRDELNAARPVLEGEQTLFVHGDSMPDVSLRRSATER